MGVRTGRIFYLGIFNLYSNAIVREMKRLPIIIVSGRDLTVKYMQMILCEYLAVREKVEKHQDMVRGEKNRLTNYFKKGETMVNSKRRIPR